MMKKEELIAQCKYFKNQSICPFDDDMLHWFWSVERSYVMHSGAALGEIDYFDSLVPKDKFSSIPRNLLLAFFTSWGKSVYDFKKELPQFYKIIQDYIDIAE